MLQRPRLWPRSPSKPPRGDACSPYFFLAAAPHAAPYLLQALQTELKLQAGVRAEAAIATLRSAAMPAMPHMPAMPTMPAMPHGMPHMPHMPHSDGPAAPFGVRRPPSQLERLEHTAAAAAAHPAARAAAQAAVQFPEHARRQRAAFEQDILGARAAFAEHQQRERASFEMQVNARGCSHLSA